MKLDYNPLLDSLFSQPQEEALISIIECFDKIKSEIGFNKIAYPSEIKSLVEKVIIGALFVPYELSADYVKNGDNHIIELTKLLNELLIARHKYH